MENIRQVEKKWQDYWEKNKTYVAKNGEKKEPNESHDCSI